MSLDINEFANMVHKNAHEKGFHEMPEDIWFKDSCNNMHGEVSELWEAARKGALDLACDKAPVCNLTCGEEELADIVIRALDSMRRLGYNPEQILLEKHKYNIVRPYKHGKLN